MKYLQQYKRATKDDISALIFDKLSPVLSEKQKLSKIQNLLSSLRIKGSIEYKDGMWQLKR